MSGKQISSDFFNIGNLRESAVSFALSYGGADYAGTKAECQKYDDIIRLNDRIQEFLGWILVDKHYGNFTIISLAISNIGTAFDEDIEIILTFSAKDLIMHDELPTPDEPCLIFIEESDLLESLFGIPSTADYNDFDSSRRPSASNNYVPSSLGLAYRKNYEDSYAENLDDFFPYDFFGGAGGDTVVKLRIDYLKHNTTVAFPTVLFVHNNIQCIRYSITSKHNSHIVEGTLRI